MRLIFLGAPGAGKGTQADKICKELGIAHISTGDILREAVSKQTEVGLKAKAYMEKGELVPDEIVIDIVSVRLQESDCEKGFLLDGFPRTFEQSKELDQKLDELNLNIDCVVNFTVDEDLVVKRITGRRLCSSCGENYHLIFKASTKQDVCDKCGAALYQRKDDNEETVRTRLNVFKEQSMPLVAYYKEKEILKEISANEGIDEVYATVKQLLVVSRES